MLCTARRRHHLFLMAKQLGREAQTSLLVSSRLYKLQVNLQAYTSSGLVTDADVQGYEDICHMQPVSLPTIYFHLDGVRAALITAHAVACVAWLCGMSIQAATSRALPVRVQAERQPR